MIVLGIKDIVIFMFLLVRYLKSDPSTISPNGNSTEDNTDSSNATDIPESDVEHAIVLDVGKYTTQDFSYYNFQNQVFDDSFNDKWNADTNKCYDDYIKCLLSQDNPIPVCGFNRPKAPKEYDGFRTFNSYCDLYFDNCRRAYRHWKIIDNGKCTYYYDKLIESFKK